ncbi:class I SAM-dependent methyltransferase [Staphylococcus xylosus]|uniref:Class I SAM-dependent methyltransferase n=1 Tax=Staphylococcus xylosus TaxID=1288 RepID=A0A5R9B242_STAXY|nr:class I SAM-dependent methyltransferase [Staphylococcus xylosus]AID43884.1 Ubiquinone/menaquinone biosynthesis methyltransferase UbiE, 2-heptaprenyl-1,4-naphthoquinone methyltransferase [Staphylococcus xylosus]RIM84856.1 class I SAM-dependent methyltransferase [Staphylococcus xylosus]RIM88689.1 class I SAM-dependent methyltransferase [Staphylococcus xylosus]TLP89999.1 class I SAM-dependent methyltransferase [Staphylococcus xylosus]WRY40104.1 class I SAM-dependent methyltransferase [Staphylo
MNKDRFDQIAQKYDDPERIHLAHIITQAITQQIKDTNYQTLLDYGGGTGLVTLNIAEYFEALTLMDASPQMVDIFEHKVSDLNQTSINTLVGDVLLDDTILNHKNYDVIVLSLVLLHSGNYQLLLQKLYNHLNSGGMMILVDFDKNENIYHPKVYNGFEQMDIIHVFNELGLRNPQINTFYSGEKIFMKQDASLFIATGTKL